MKKILFLISLLVISLSFSLNAQDRVSWTFELKQSSDSEVKIVATAIIEAGWHLYSTDIPDGGPNPTEISFDKIEGASVEGVFEAVDSKLYTSFDKQFEMEIGYYKDKAIFVQRIKVLDVNKFIIEGDIRAQACNDTECTPPLPIDFSFKSKDLPASIKSAEGAGQADEKDEAGTIQAEAVVDVVKSNEPTNASTKGLWSPVISELHELGAVGSVSNSSLLWIFISGFLGGLIALLTPCVWPMIPMTVSFFLKRNKTNRKDAIADAVKYGVSIIFIYVLLGLVITGIFGASALNELSTSAFFNLIFFALLVVFAISFMGAFEMVLPASWTNKMDAKADKTSGLLSIFFMAFTLALVSFSCTGPIIGTLLVETASTGQSLAPAIGMSGFAFALAIPFTLFAIFPSWLQSMPKSGGWLNSVKVVLGFLELALALKFLSVADLAYGWRILDREVFLVLWIVIFAMLGFYLLGKIKFSHDSDLPYVSVPRLFMSIISLSFALYMVPGLWGAPLKSISAFSPPQFTQDFDLYKGGVHANFDDYETGMNYAKQVGKPVMIDFSGFGCVNCRKMEASVWTDARVKSLLENDYVLITLMVDDKTRLPEIIEVEENGRKSKLKTIGDKWSYLQRHKFGQNSQPFYVGLDHNGNPVTPSYAFDEDVSKYLKFLETGVSNFKKK